MVFSQVAFTISPANVTHLLEETIFCAYVV